MKFGGYKINYKTLYKNKLSDGSIKAVAELSGTIEIGIDIDKWTWRGDWIADKILKDDSNKYRISSVSNNYTSYSPVEVNRVEVVFSEK